LNRAELIFFAFDVYVFVSGVVVSFVDSFRDQLLYIALGSGYALVRAMGTTIESGTTGLLFSFGIVKKELKPGFHLLIPYLQKVRRIATRSRTLDLPAQRVATFEGLVYHVDASLVYRIVDVRKALVEIDVVEKGMVQMLGLGVQEVLRTANADSVQSSKTLDAALSKNLAERLEPWGVEVERAGFSSITPSQKTLRITQLAGVTGERQRMLEHLEAPGIQRTGALALIGTRTLPRRRARHLQRMESRRRRQRHLRKTLMQYGYLNIQIAQAERSLRARATTSGKVKAKAATAQTEE